MLLGGLLEAGGGQTPRMSLPLGGMRGLHPRRGQGQALAALWGGWQGVPMLGSGSST